MGAARIDHEQGAGCDNKVWTQKTVTRAEMWIVCKRGMDLLTPNTAQGRKPVTYLVMFRNRFRKSFEELDMSKPSMEILP